MSHSFRQPVGAQPSIPVAQTPLPARIVAPICTTGSPAVYPIVPNAYGLLSQQHQQYVAQSVVYPHQPITNVQNRVPFVPAVSSNIPRMFIPVSPVPSGISTLATDPTRLLEEQRRLEKERNFQLQQERLKQFTISGKKSNINPDNLIDSMFGKIQPKKNSANALGCLPSKTNEINKTESKSKRSFIREKIGYETSMGKSNVSSVVSETIATVPVLVKKDVKELDSMMLECSNLNVSSKAVKFQKPSVKEITPSSSHKTTFIASEKARDWRDIKGLDEVFTAPKPRFPVWCDRKKVSDLYKNVQAIVTNNDLHEPDTNLLFRIFASSGLPRELLGEIWELVNESGSGQLSVEEMYAALALIAVAQAGYPVKNTDVLETLSSCPIPHLNLFLNTSNLSEANNSLSLPSDENISSETGFKEQSEQPVHQILRPTAISIKSHTQLTDDYTEIVNVTQKAATWTPFTDSSNTPDDEFADFQSATPTAINYSLSTPASHNPSASDDEFDDFKQAPCTKAQEHSISNVKLPVTAITTKDENKTVSLDLLSSEEDKYSVFRTLQQTEDNNQWADFTFSSVSHESPSTFSNDEGTHNKENSTSLNYPSVLVTDSTLSNSRRDTNIATNTQEDEEFGDFVHANVSSVSPYTTVTDFADFSNFKEAGCEKLCVSQLDDEFGEFTSCVSVSLKPELGQDFLFNQLKDNISLAESQSVSSLELGTFDGGGGHSGESKSSLSRQGSIPSLDLKSAVFDGTDSEDCAGEIQLSPYVPRNSKSPSPTSITKAPDESETCSAPLGQFFQSTALPFTDKYSVIRQEKLKDEDQHISCWTRCLESGINILQNMKKIFNQMSCSSVCNEVISSEEGGNYVKNVIEVYKVICRVGLSCKTLGKQTEAVLDLLNEADQVWNTLSGFFAGSALMPEDSSLDFSSGVLKAEPENNAKACGLCLLKIELRSKSFKQEECPKLSYGGRNYHSTCANFWVNCVDPLLPALVLPQLL